MALLYFVFERHLTFRYTRVVRRDTHGDRGIRSIVWASACAVLVLALLIVTGVRLRRDSHLVTDPAGESLSAPVATGDLGNPRRQLERAHTPGPPTTGAISGVTTGSSVIASSEPERARNISDGAAPAIARHQLPLPTFMGSASASERMTTFQPVPNASQVRIDGTSTAHDWVIKSTTIAGVFALGTDFLANPPAIRTGAVPAKVEASVPVRTLKSYTTRLDAVMYQALKMSNYAKIQYQLDELRLRETPRATNVAFHFDSAGELAIAGVTQRVSFPVTLVLNSNVLRASGQCSVNMSDFDVTPPATSVPGLGKVVAGDKVQITFDWVAVRTEDFNAMTGRRAAP